MKPMFSALLASAMIMTTASTVIAEPLQEREKHEKQVVEIQKNVEEVSGWMEQYKEKQREEELHTVSRLSYKQVTKTARMTPIGEGPANTLTMDLLTPSSITAYEIDLFLQGTPMEGLGKSFVLAEIETGVNALFLTSLAIHESGWGSSAIANDKNNLFGYGAYDTTPYSSALSFKTKAEGVEYVANKIKEDYLLPSGRFSNGATLQGMNVLYSTDKKWGAKIAETMQGLSNKAMANQFSEEVVE